MQYVLHNYKLNKNFRMIIYHNFDKDNFLSHFKLY